MGNTNILIIRKKLSAKELSETFTENVTYFFTFSLEHSFPGCFGVIEDHPNNSEKHNLKFNKNDNNQKC